MTEFRPTRARGLTLIELMVALTIFSILGVLSYRAVASVTQSVERVTSDFQRWRDIAQFFNLMETDVLQMAARPSTFGVIRSSITYGQSSTGAQLSFIRLDGSGQTVQRRGYRFAGDQIVLLTWPMVSSSAPPTQDVVLDKVKSLNISFITSTGLRVASWSASSAGGSDLPAAVEVEVGLADQGTVRRVFAVH